ncbi:MAG: tetratricopeptide (TPR) repeat protein [Pseudohongiellaceae bacterium]|jgi:tetratricopeptide (TPR) repeat protein
MIKAVSPPFLILFIALLPLVFVSQSAESQSDNSVLNRYGNLEIERVGPTIDAALAQKLLRRGNTYSNLERYDDAVDEYRKAISADPNLLEAVRNLANTYYFLEKYSEAKPLFARFIAMQEQTTAGLIAAVTALAEMEREEGNFEESVKFDLRAIELNPTNDSQVHVMANTYNNAGEADKAIQIYQAGVKAIPSNGFFDRSLGRILEQEGRLEEALRAYEGAALKNPDSPFYADLVETTKRRLNQRIRAL